VLGWTTAAEGWLQQPLNGSPPLSLSILGACNTPRVVLRGGTQYKVGEERRLGKG
jgi:hypothetical protein